MVTSSKYKLVMSIFKMSKYSILLSAFVLVYFCEQTVQLRRTISVYDRIIFPDESEIMKPNEKYHNRRNTTAPQMECDFNDNLQVYWEETNSCQTLLLPGPCKDNNYWLVLEQNTLKPVCRKRPCPAQQAYIEKKCQPISKMSLCAPGMMLFHTAFGEAICDCEPGKVFWPSDYKCYDPYTRGPCEYGEVVALDIDDSVSCIHNPCPQSQSPDDTIVYYNGNCFKLMSSEPCMEGVLSVNTTTLQIQCVPEVNAFQLLDTPIQGCPKGSKRDYAGVCRRMFGSFGRAAKRRNGYSFIFRPRTN